MGGKGKGVGGGELEMGWGEEGGREKGEEGWGWGDGKRVAGGRGKEG